MTNKKFTRTSPDKANELFAKLLDTSDNAIKTRERLFADLKEELEFLATLQERHLFPILRKHDETRDLVHEALNDNKETSALLAELERVPKNNAEFIRKVTRLKEMFHQHIRDDKNELLPAVLKVLNDEEAAAVADNVEQEMAAIEQTKRDQAGQLHTEVERERDQIETVQQIAADVADSVRAGADGVQGAARAAQDAMQNGFGAASEFALHSTEGFAGSALHNLEAITQSSTVLTLGVQNVSREWFRLSQERLQKNLDGLNALARCRSAQDVAKIQSALVQDNLEQMVENSRRVAELSLEVASDAARTVAAAHGGTAPDRPSHVA